MKIIIAISIIITGIVIILLNKRFRNPIIINKVICDEFITTPIILEPTLVSWDKDIVFRYNLHFCKLNKKFIQNPRKTYKTDRKTVLFEEYHVALGSEDASPILIAVEPIIVKNHSRMDLSFGMELVVRNNNNYYRCKIRNRQEIRPNKDNYGDSAKDSQIEIYIGEKRYYTKARGIVGKIVATYADYYYEKRNTGNKDNRT
jgi:hypothetical protein